MTKKEKDFIYALQFGLAFIGVKLVILLIDCIKEMIVC